MTQEEQTLVQSKRQYFIHNQINLDKVRPWTTWKEADANMVQMANFAAHTNRPYLEGEVLMSHNKRKVWCWTTAQKGVHIRASGNIRGWSGLHSQFRDLKETHQPYVRWTLYKVINTPPVRQVNLINTPTVRQVNLIHTPPVRQVNLINTPTVRQVNLIYTPPVRQVSPIHTPTVRQVNLINTPPVRQVNLINTPTVRQVNLINTPTVRQVNLIHTPPVRQVNLINTPTVRQVNLINTPTVRQVNTPTVRQVNLINTPTVRQVNFIVRDCSQLGGGASQHPIGWIIDSMAIFDSRTEVGRDDHDSRQSLGASVNMTSDYLRTRQSLWPHLGSRRFKYGLWLSQNSAVIMTTPRQQTF